MEPPPPPPPPRPRDGGVDKYDFYYWLGCQILVLGDSIRGKLVEAIQDGDVHRLKGQYMSPYDPDEGPSITGWRVQCWESSRQPVVLHPIFGSPTSLGGQPPMQTVWSTRVNKSIPPTEDLKNPQTYVPMPTTSDERSSSECSVDRANRLSFDPYDLPNDVRQLTQIVYSAHGVEAAVAFLRGGVHIFSGPNFDQVDSYHVNVGSAIAPPAFSSSSCCLASVWHDTLKDRTILKSELSSVIFWLVSGMKKNTRAKLAKMYIDRNGLLQLAVFLGKLDVCRYFVEDLGFDVNCSDLCGAPLDCASLFGDVACARFLLDHGADPNKMDKTGSVALHKAAKNGNGELIQLLLSRGARVDIAIPQGTPLHIAASYGNCDAVKILLDHHADPNFISEVSGSPLVSALQSTKLVNESDSLECVKLLIKAGADVNSANPKTPLEVATVNGLTDCIKCLLEAGADPNIAKNQVEKNGKTAKLKLKLDGEKAVRRKNYLAASKLYTQAIELDPDDATLYSNRSLCHLRIGEANKALLDANRCIKIQPEWLKGYYRKGVAHMSLKEYKEASDAFLAGLKLDPTNIEMERMLREAIEAMKKDHYQ